jgi:hypothetical protein
MKLIGEEQVEKLEERHYTVPELAESWHLSPLVVRKLFEKEPGVVIFCQPKMNKRTYRTLRIPESVAKRVYLKSLVIMKSSERQ